MSEIVNTNNFKCISILPDGNCQYRSVSYCLSKSENLYKRVKKNAIEYIIENKDTFLNYIYDITFDEFIENISEENEWGDEITLLAISLYLGIEINVYDRNTNEKISTYNETINETGNQLSKIYLYFNNVMQHYDAIEIVKDGVINHQYNTRSTNIVNINNINTYNTYNTRNVVNYSNKVSSTFNLIPIIKDKYNLYRVIAYHLYNDESLHKEIVQKVYKLLLENKKMIDEFITRSRSEYVRNNDHILNYILGDMEYNQFIKKFIKYKVFPDKNILQLIASEMNMDIVIHDKETHKILKVYGKFNNINKIYHMYFDETTLFYDAMSESKKEFNI